LQLNIRGRLVLGFSVLCLLLAGVIGTTIVKVHTVREATDRTVNLRVPTAMTASDFGGGRLCFACIAARLADYGNDAFKTERAGLWKDIQTRGSERTVSRATGPSRKQAGLAAGQALLDELRSAQDKAEAIALPSTSSPRQKSLRPRQRLWPAHAAESNLHHRRGRQHCLDPISARAC